MPVRHRPPHPARTGEVLARPGVVDAAVAGRREAALDAADLLGDVEVGAVQLVDRLVGQRLHPVAEGLLAGDAGGPGRRRARRPPRRSLAPAPAISRGRPRASRPPAGAAPRSPRRRSRRRSTLAPRKYWEASSYRSRPAACFSRPQRGQLGRAGTRRTRRSPRWPRRRPARARRASAPSALDPVGQAVEEVVPRRVGPDRRTAWRPRPSAARALTWPASAASRSVRLYCSRACGKAVSRAAMLADRLLALGRHQVEGHAAMLVQRAGDHVDLAGRRRRRRSGPARGRAAPASPPWPRSRTRSPGSIDVELGQRAPGQARPAPRSPRGTGRPACRRSPAMPT